MCFTCVKAAYTIQKAFKVEGDDNLHGVNLKYLRNEPFAMTVTGGKTRSFYDSISNCAGFTPNVVYRTQSMPTLQSFGGGRLLLCDHSGTLFLGQRTSIGISYNRDRYPHRKRLPLCGGSQRRKLA